MNQDFFFFFFTSQLTVSGNFTAFCLTWLLKWLVNVLGILLQGTRGKCMLNSKENNPLQFQMSWYVFKYYLKECIDVTLILPAPLSLFTFKAFSPLILQTVSPTPLCSLSHSSHPQESEQSENTASF